MPSVTSCFNRTLFRSALKRNWPLWCGYAILLFLVVPGVIGNYLVNRQLSLYDVRYFILQESFGGGIAVSAIFGIVFAVAMFAYLDIPRATGGMHALPLRRSCLFLSHYLAGLFAQIVTQLFAFGVAALVCLPHTDFGAIATGFAVYALSTVFFYSFGVFCMHCSGQILAAPVFYVIFNFLAIAMEIAVGSVADLFLYGFYTDSADYLCDWLSPVVFLSGNTSVDCIYDNTAQLCDVCFCGLSYYFLYAAAGVAFAAVAFLLYRKRRSEHSGNTVVFSRMYPVFQFGVAFCSAFSVGIAVYWIFFSGQTNGHGNLPGAIASLSAAALLGYYAASMLLKKSFHVFRKSIGSVIAIIAVLAAFCICLERDVTDFEKKLPDADEIASVNVDLWSSGDHFHDNLYGRDAIDSVLALHALAVSPEGTEAGSDYYDYQNSEACYDENTNYAEIELDYTLQNGKHMRRSYAFLLPQGADVIDDALTNAFMDFLGQKEVVCTYMLGLNQKDFDKDWIISGGQCMLFTANNNSDDFGLSAGEAQAIMDAAIADVEAEHYRQLTPLYYGDSSLCANCSVDFRLPQKNYVENCLNLTICCGMTKTVAVIEEITGVEIA